MDKTFWQNTLQRRLDRRGFLTLMGAAGVSGAIAACSGDSNNTTTSGSTETPAGGTTVNVTRPETWVESTHGNNPASFAKVFPDNKVLQVKLKISADNWQAMLDDMTTLFGTRGTSIGGGGGFNPAQVPDGAAPGGVPGMVPGGGGPPGGMVPGGGGLPGGGGGGTASTRKPMWVAGDLEFEGSTWTKVGIRFKGNSSLRTAWQGGTDRLPFKLDFDEWETDFPEIQNQRFYGFKQLSLSNNTGDATYMRETIAYDVFEEAGLAAANTAFYEVILDRGEGEASLGIYTVIEVIDDTVVQRVFGEDSGNIYEAEGSAASLAANVAPQIKTSFQKENNDTEADWSDIEKLHSVLNSATRTSDLDGWRKELEAIFDVPVFLEWLAIATTIQHWDTYGGMTHNFYLYNNPDNGKLTWISWDHNFILGASIGGGGGNANPNAPADQNANRGMAGRMNTSFAKTEVTNSWPLIRYLLDVPDYYAEYRKYLKETVDGPFNAKKMQTKYEKYAATLGPYAEKLGTATAFQTALQTLIQNTNSRNQAVSDFLAT